jgi:hypothetical protein
LSPAIAKSDLGLARCGAWHRSFSRSPARYHLSGTGQLGADLPLAFFITVEHGPCSSSPSA